ncbi:MAG: FAD-binding protein [Chloroflexota bacterium]
MSQLLVDATKCDRCGACSDACPFGAVSVSASGVAFSDACRLCRICLKRCPRQAISLASAAAPAAPADLAAWRGVLVFAEQRDGMIQPVTLELIGKAHELAGKVGQDVSVVLAGEGVAAAAEELRHYAPARVLVYDHPALRHFRAETYTNVLTDAVRRLTPNVILIGATAAGRSLAPRVATSLRTGLTADCTVLDIRPGGELVRTRPAFGGNVMAMILTPRRRPQMATVRYKVMEAAPRHDSPSGDIVNCGFRDEWQARGRVLAVVRQAQAVSIAEADVVVAVGRGVKAQRDLEMIERFARAVGGVIGCTRPLVEQGWLPNNLQIGLSGRTVRPRLFIAVGISGAIQHIAGMRSSGVIFAINQDARAPIFDVAHYALVGDLYEIIPELTRLIEEGGVGRAV